MNLLIELPELPIGDFNDWEMRWGPGQVEWVSAIAALLIPLALFFFWTSLRRIHSVAKKILLLGLRVLAFALLLLVLLRPQLELRKIQLLKNSIAVLLDDSKSMSIKIQPGEKTRLDLARAVFEKNRGYFETLQKDFQVDYFFVSDGIVPTSLTEVSGKYKARGAYTDLDKALADLKAGYEGKSLQGAMLFSDGADLGEDASEVSAEAAATLSRFGAPVHAFQTGTNENFKDLGIEKLEVADFAFVQQQVTVTAHVNAFSIGDKNIPVAIKEGDKVLISKILEIREGQTRYKIELPFTPTVAGKKLYSVSVPLFAGESIDINNRREFPVKVIRDRIRTLHLNGRPSWDSRFLREVLTNNPKVDLLSFFILRSVSDDVEAATAELSLIPFPSNLLVTEYLDSFDLVIFHNFKYAPFIEKKFLDNIKKFVEKGGAFIMIGGELSFQGGDYADTPIEEILPMRIQKAPASMLQDEFKPHIQKRFIHHPILKLEKDEELSAGAWASLPNLNALNIGLKPVKDAQVLIDYEKPGSFPVLAVRKVGEGRTLALATDSSWNWNFLRVGEGGSGRHYQAFWNNVIEWMTDEPGGQIVKIETDKERYREQEKATIKIKLLQEDYNPLSGEKFKLTINSVSGKRTVSTQTLETDKAGEAFFEFAPQEEGFYAARAERTWRGKTLFREAHFGVVGDAAEFEKPMINAPFLQAMAKATGGAHQILDEKTELNEHRFPNPEMRAQTKSKIISLWDNWWSYGLIVGLLLADWWMRRRSGLS